MNIVPIWAAIVTAMIEVIFLVNENRFPNVILLAIFLTLLKIHT